MSDAIYCGKAFCKVREMPVVSFSPIHIAA